MAKPNYQFDKRQREIAKKQKQEEKRLKKLARNAGPDDGSAMPLNNESATPTEKSV